MIIVSFVWRSLKQAPSVKCPARPGRSCAGLLRTYDSKMRSGVESAAAFAKIGSVCRDRQRRARVADGG
jgi:hypothetical protein